MKRDKKQNKKKGKVFTGLLRVSSKGHGYFEHKDIDKTVEIFPENMNTALNGDGVKVSLLSRKTPKGLKGKVEEIIERSRMSFVGTIGKEDGVIFATPDDKRFYMDIIIPSFKGKIPVGEKAVVKIKKWTDQNENPEGEITKVLGPKGKNDVEMEAIIIERGFEKDFPKKVMEEAEKISELGRVISKEEVEKRIDMRGVTTFTIDPVDAKDFDDALSCNFLDNGDVEIGIHIADVSHYVKENTPINDEAIKRGFSVYLVDRTIPMLPNVLSEDLCSLKPDEDKLTFSAIFIFSSKGEIKEYNLGKSIIRSNKRFTYEEAQGVLDSEKGPFLKELKELERLAKILREDKFESGAIAFGQDEVKFELDSEGRPIRVYRKERIETNLLVEDFMLLANKKVAEYVNDPKKIKGTGGFFIYRIHDEPDKDKIEELSIFLKALGHEFESKGGKTSSKDINKMLKSLEGGDDEALIKTATVRSMAKAIYSTKNIGHFGLAFKNYSHFTSPIRRYPDLLVHRLLEKYLSGEKIHSQDFAKYEALAIKSSAKEIEAVAAERDSIKYKQVEYMSEKIGEKFEGIISGLTDWGIYVEESETRSSGLVALRKMDDFFTLDNKNYSLVGEKSGKKYRLGDKVKFKVSAADLEARTLDYELI